MIPVKGPFFGCTGIRALWSGVLEVYISFICYYAMALYVDWRVTRGVTWKNVTFLPARSVRGVDTCRCSIPPLQKLSYAGSVVFFIIFSTCFFSNLFARINIGAVASTATTTTNV